MGKNIREGVTRIFDGCYSRELSVCPKHSIFQRQKALNEILSYLKSQIEQTENPFGERDGGFYRGYEHCRKDILALFRED